MLTIGHKNISFTYLGMMKNMRHGCGHLNIQPNRMKFSQILSITVPNWVS